MNKTMQKIFDYIILFKKAHNGNSPTLREIMDGCYVGSTSVVHYHLTQLESKGMIMRKSGMARMIEVVRNTGAEQ